ncbi:hypothetical protein [Dinghuibacter silviterrae]|uniref:Uncharacterized protein n=1 Tax=Dinghuibacter silviterrae TaxID=1539049 RepID=A0A4R8DGB8_9BACT|nr:hypothetical protein [Dinghuibacter silviterrae]TDW96497.1 hypothetical protein EDB95_4328 [Dinghuibacter silviterrae]
MTNRICLCLIALVPLAALKAQDTSVNVQGRYIQLSEVVVRSDIDVRDFIRRVQEDTTFYKAFKNLRVLSYSAINDIRMVDKRGNMVASLNSRTHQSRIGNCRTMQVLDEKTTGDIRDNEGNWNYITGQLYAALFFTNGSVCGETNIVTGAVHNVENLSGMEKHKEQLKLLFFNPGKPIPGVPFLGNKMDIFSPDAAKRYDYSIDMQRYNGQDCYVFKIKAKDDAKGSVVIDEMTTWFDPKTMDVLGRVYDMSYDAGVYDFNVHMEAQLSKYGDLLVPTLLRYNGNWGVLFKKRERGIFTATLFDFGK